MVVVVVEKEKGNLDPGMNDPPPLGTRGDPLSPLAMGLIRGRDVVNTDSRLCPRLRHETLGLPATKSLPSSIGPHRGPSIAESVR